MKRRVEPLVVDANIVFAALIRGGSTRELILDRGLDLRTPPWLWEEVAARYGWLRDKSGLTATALDAFLQLLRRRIQDIPDAAIFAHKQEALRQAGTSGRKDAPYLAAVMAVGGTLWTHDRKLAADCPVAVCSTADVAAQYL